MSISTNKNNSTLRLENNEKEKKPKNLELKKYDS